MSDYSGDGANVRFAPTLDDTVSALRCVGRVLPVDGSINPVVPAFGGRSHLTPIPAFVLAVSNLVEFGKHIWLG